MAEENNGPAPFLMDAYGHLYPNIEIFAKMDGMRPHWLTKTAKAATPTEKDVPVDMVLPSVGKKFEGRR